ncbi:MAG: hydrogenase expression/formation protein HypE [Planctomycetes bacterium]|nr:hydrogenase expression/formation protein HypE [Planctomycetota bacterium]
MIMDETILLAHGGGGRLTGQLVSELFVPALDNPWLRTMSDAAVLPPLPAGRPALTTDGFVVDPLEFPGGDLGYLSVCGTVNDLAVAGAIPLWLTWALILEEGCSRELLTRLTAGAARAAGEAGVTIVAGDTKVVPRGKGDRAFAVTSGLGVVPPDRELGDARVTPGDVLVSSGSLGDHGAVILACRHGMVLRDLVSDCSPVSDLVGLAFASGAAIRVAHDPTRGGVATVCNEVALRARVGIELDEDAIHVREETRGVCDLLGLDPLYLACEGRVIFFVAADDAAGLVAALRAHPNGCNASVIGAVISRDRAMAPVVLRTAGRGVHPLDYLSGIELPRIC